MMVERVNTTDIPEITDFSSARPNPYAEKIKKHGYSVTIRYSPADVERMTRSALEKAKNLDILELDSEELKALERYKKANQQ
ncbi:MAG: hypothetical protein FWG94_03715 [Oscillospiraceae bacterium]|nr:hypothetical protein [Oscillospiraceae bacterium]